MSIPIEIYYRPSAPGALGDAFRAANELVRNWLDHRDHQHFVGDVAGWPAVVLQERIFELLLERAGFDFDAFEAAYEKCVNDTERADTVSRFEEIAGAT